VGVSNKRVTVLRGGPSSEYEVSLKTGKNVIKSLEERDYNVVDVIITKNGEWLYQGVVRNPEQLLLTTDVVFNALHGEFGEDGEVQRLLERYKVPYTGSRSLPAAIAFNKHLTKETLKQHGVKMPQHRVVTVADVPNIDAVVQSIVAALGPSYIVKPLANGSSVGVSMAKDELTLKDSILGALQDNDYLMVEEFVTGREATCAVLNNFRDEKTYVFPVIEIIPPPEELFFTTKAKYGGDTREICPGNFSYQERAELADVAAHVHEVLGLSQYSRSDFIIKNGTPYFLEVNTLPGLTAESLFPKAAAAVGLSFTDLVTHLVDSIER